MRRAPACAVAVVALVACGGSSAVAPPAAGPDLPDDPTYAGAVGVPSCLVMPEEGVLVVDWDAPTRAVLDESMRRGIAVVHYDCHSFYVMPACTADGAYGNIAMTRKEQVVHMSGAADVASTMPLTGSAIASRLEGELARGASVDISLVIAGRRSTTRGEIAPADLRGDCAGATHFVRATTLGGFAVRVSRPRSGIAEVTNAPDSSETALRVALARIGEPTPAARAAAKGAPTYACAEWDEADCTDQCERGHAGSCATLAEMFRAGTRVEKKPEHALELFVRACDGGEPRGCRGAGEMLARPQGVPTDDARAGDFFMRACDGRDAAACEDLAELASDFDGPLHDPARAIRLHERACDLGEARGCTRRGEAWIDGEGQAHDMRRGVELLRRGCARGDDRACARLVGLGDG